MRKLPLIATATASVALAYYPLSVINLDRKYLNRFAVLLLRYDNSGSPPLVGLQLDTERDEIERMLLTVRTIRLRSWSRDNRDQARNLIGKYNEKFLPKTAAQGTAA